MVRETHFVAEPHTPVLQAVEKLKRVGDTSKGQSICALETTDVQGFFLIDGHRGNKPLSGQQTWNAGFVMLHEPDQILIIAARLGSRKNNRVGTANALQGFTQSSQRREAATSKGIGHINKKQIQVAIKLQVLKPIIQQMGIY